MNKTAIKNFAVWARNKLIEGIIYKAGLIGVTEKGIASPLPQSDERAQFFDIGTPDYAQVRDEDIARRDSFIAAIRDKEKEIGYPAAFAYVVEKVAYTWFNRLIAIRFMEINDYLPSHVRVLSSEREGKSEPDMVTRPFDTDLQFTEKEREDIIRLQDNNGSDELFRLLFIKQCYKLHEILPRLFDAEPNRYSGDRDYMALLLGISFTDKDGVLWRLVHDIREQDFRVRTPEDDERQRVDNIPEEDMPAGQVQIIGWMYQYYNTEPKDDVFAALKKNVKISKDKIPAATALFTPHWIVRYMVENSLGRLWLEGHPDGALRAGWKYYLDEAEQEPDVQKQLDALRAERDSLRPEDIKVIDPCMGSGHILVYMFDVLMQIYISQGWTAREAAQSIVRNNLYGLEIDERAAQFAYFAVMMKARQYDRRFFDRGIEPHTYRVAESGHTNKDGSSFQYVSEASIEYFAGNNTELRSAARRICSELFDAGEYGSIIMPERKDFDALYARLDELEDDIKLNARDAVRELRPVIHTADLLSRQYDVVVTNPPYMGGGGMNARLTEYVKEHYPDSKADMSTVFMERCMSLCTDTGYMAMINIPVWMFLSSFEKLREKLLKIYTFINMVHPGRGIFGSDFGTTTFIICRNYIESYIGTYKKLFDNQGEVKPNDVREREFFEDKKIYFAKQDNFSKIPGSPIAYWVSDVLQDTFTKYELMETFAPPKQGSTLGINDRFLRFWYEVEIYKHTKWFPCVKGGEYRKWYGNHYYVIDWEDNGKRVKSTGRATIRNADKLFHPGIHWSRITISKSSFRELKEGFFFESAAGVCFPKTEDIYYTLGLLNSKIVGVITSAINPTLTLQSGDVACIPVKLDNKRLVEELVYQNTNISKSDWDSFETSWDFKRHPLIPKRAQSPQSPAPDTDGKSEI